MDGGMYAVYGMRAMIDCVYAMVELVCEVGPEI